MNIRSGDFIETITFRFSSNLIDKLMIPSAWIYTDFNRKMK